MRQKRYSYRKNKRQIYIIFIERDGIWYWQAKDDIPLYDVTINPDLTLYQNLDKIRTIRGSEFVTKTLAAL